MTNRPAPEERGPVGFSLRLPGAEAHHRPADRGQGRREHAVDDGIVERLDAEAVARRDAPEATLRRIDAILACREALEGNVAPLLALESLLVTIAGRR